jgi:hypothetical protein
VYHDPEDSLSWYDQPLFRSPGVGVAIPAVGAFLPGYLLASPVVHLSSVQGLPAASRARFVDFVEQVAAQVCERYGQSTIFEHGSCRQSERRRSACLTHAHVHIVPGCYSFDLLRLPVQQEFLSLKEFSEAPAVGRLDGYLMYREPGGPVCYSRDLGISQFFRRHIASVRGTPDDWDYALFPHFANIRATIDDLTVTRADSPVPSI